MMKPAEHWERDDVAPGMGGMTYRSNAAPCKPAQGETVRDDGPPTLVTVREDVRGIEERGVFHRGRWDTLAKVSWWRRCTVGRMT